MDKILGEGIKPPDFISTNPLGNNNSMLTLLNNILRLLIVVGGVYALLNFVLAGFQFISAGGDPKKIEAAWGKIWQSIVGLLIIVASFALAGLLSKIMFGDYKTILNPTIYGPGI
jgi:hypothetical protein